MVVRNAEAVGHVVVEQVGEHFVPHTWGAKRDGAHVRHEVEEHHVERGHGGESAAQGMADYHKLGLRVCEGRA